METDHEMSKDIAFPGLKVTGLVGIIAGDIGGWDAHGWDDGAQEGSKDNENFPEHID